eukprot:CAMPEP_0113958356 /NCGR_PEP_ID=MMETSP0011_2-20120614/3361_1 /TAXON_ID=101924 /ORGANISM="Rhodosorus marinus" /LENGTH=185 /DNA_ID=CAMNT_0000969183 /DNA_START=74 /DNA_END=631 /DNA_ORIENTATION=- /assembly_acc=CAM_ASM_000156
MSRRHQHLRHACQECGKRFKYRYNVREHARVHNNQRPFQCGFDGCEETFKWRSSGRCHMKKCPYGRHYPGDRIPACKKIYGSRVSTSFAQVAAHSAPEVSAQSVADPMLGHGDHDRVIEDMIHYLYAPVQDHSNHKEMKTNIRPMALGGKDDADFNMNTFEFSETTNPYSPDYVAFSPDNDFGGN